MSTRRILLVEDDPSLRFIGVMLAAEPPAALLTAFRDFFAHDLPDLDAWLADIRSRLAPIYPCEVRFFANDEELNAALPAADALIVEAQRISADAIQRARSLKVLQKFGTATANIDADACAARGIVVRTLRRRALVSCAEHTLGLMLALARKINETDGLVSLAQLRAAGYRPAPFDRTYTANSNWARIGGLRTLYESQLGIIGCGEIGREVALRAGACGMKVVYTQRTRLAAADEARYGVTHAPLDTLLATSDFVSIHVPGIPATRGLLGKRELEQIRPGSILINTARAELVDHAALLNALASGRLAGYGTDVPYEEPARDDDPLLGRRNVIVTPHIAAQPRFNALSDFEEMLTGIARALPAQGDRT